jgi:uncharacterized protein (TIGR04255 family)
VSGPFDDPNPGNVPLADAPLVRVLAQVRFPQFSQFLSEEDQVARKFAALVAEEYPLFEQGMESVVMITPDGLSTQPGASKLWRLRAADASWQVSFAHNFVSLETSSYVRRSDFADRFEKVWEAFRSVVRPPFIERVGIRYVNRIESPDVLGRLGDFLRPEVAGVIGVPMSVGQLERTVSETLYTFGDGSAFQARCGRLPPGASLDPSLPPAAVPSWVLDLDSFHGWSPSEHNGEGIGEVLLGLGLRCYQFFRWATRPTFLTEFGGEVE